MISVNENYLKIQASYLFTEIAHRVKAHQEAHPEAKIIRLGIGDVTEPLAPAVIAALHKAVDDEAARATFHGYGPEQGYAFLREAVAAHDFQAQGLDIAADEIFISDGAKCDCGNIQEIFGANVRIAVGDPVYPVYVDTNVMAGRTGANAEGRYANLVYLDCTAANGYVPSPADLREPVDVVYLCYPNNPTGTVLTRKQLKRWVDYAIKNDAIIFYDAAYEAYIQEEDIPHSIYEIRGAKKCAIEFHSYSKTAGFTGVRCGYTVIPKDVKASTLDGKERIELNHLWDRRQCTKFNGTSYISQRAAEAIYTPEGKKQVKETIDYYMTNAGIMRERLQRLGLSVYGGVNAPYLWVKTPNGTASWKFFEEMLYGAGVVCTPGVGFGPSGEGYVRLTAFGNREDVEEAMGRIETWLKG